MAPAAQATPTSATRWAIAHELGASGAKVRCKRTGATSSRCTATWTEWSRWRAVVRVRRSGPTWSPVEAYRLEARIVGQKVSRRGSGVVIVPTRRARLGLPLQLVDPLAGEVAELTFLQPTSVIDDGRQMLVFPVTARQLSGEGRFHPPMGAAKLIAGGRSVSGEYLASAGCEWVDMAAGEERRTCVAFEAQGPWEQVELGNGSETGVWAP